MKDRKTLVIAILAIVILCLSGFIVWDKVLDPMINGVIIEECYLNEEPLGTIDITSQNASGDTLDTDGEEKEVYEEKPMDKISPFVEITYNYDKVLASDFRNEAKIKYAIEKELKYKKNIDELNNLPDDNRLRLDWGAVKSRVKSMFNSNVEIISSTRVDVANVGCYNVQLDEYKFKSLCTNCRYILTPLGCDVGWRFDSYETKKIKEEKKTNGTEIYMKVLHVQHNLGTNKYEVKTYIPDSTSDTGLKEKELGIIDNNNEEELEKYFDDAATYKYTFGLTNTNYYYFISSEIVKK